MSTSMHKMPLNNFSEPVATFTLKSVYPPSTFDKGLRHFQAVSFYLWGCLCPPYVNTQKALLPSRAFLEPHNICIELSNSNGSQIKERMPNWVSAKGIKKGVSLIMQMECAIYLGYEQVHHGLVTFICWQIKDIITSLISISTQWFKPLL